jgi:tetratricopeptide (TPR) repeat protein
MDAYLQALDAFEHLDANDERLRMAIEIHSRVRDVLFLLGELDKISIHLQAAAELVRRTGDREQLAWLHIHQSGSLWGAGQFDAAVVEAIEAQCVAKEIGDPALSALACYRRGIALVGLGQYVDASEVLQQALDWLDTDDGRKYFQLGGFPHSFTCSFLAWSLSELGETERALDVARAGWANAEREQHAYSLTVTAFGLCHALLLAGRTGEAIRVVERVLVASDDVDVNVASPWGKARLAYAYAVEQHVEKANALIDEVAESIFKSRTLEHASVSVWVVRALLVLGDLDRAETCLDQQQALAQKQNENSVNAWLMWMRAEIAMRRGAPDAAVQPLLNAARSLAEDLKLGPLLASCMQTSEQLAAAR